MLIDPDWTQVDNDSLFWAAEGGSAEAKAELDKRQARSQAKARTSRISPAVIATTVSRAGR